MIRLTELCSYRNNNRPDDGSTVYLPQDVDVKMYAVECVQEIMIIIRQQPKIMVIVNS
jgi:hypothetical protein